MYLGSSLICLVGDLVHPERSASRYHSEMGSGRKIKSSHMLSDDSCDMNRRPINHESKEAYRHLEGDGRTKASARVRW